MTFKEYIFEANKFYLQHRKTLRKGECYWTIFKEKNPILASSIQDTKLDPYQFDHRLKNFLDYIEDHWYDGD